MIKEQRKSHKHDKYRVPEVRVFARKGKKNTGPYLLIKCGCHHEDSFKIYYFEPDYSKNIPDIMDLEIAGVYGELDNWREIFLPLLGIEKWGKNGFKNTEWYDEFKKKNK